MGKWSHLKQKYPAPKPEASFQQQIDAVRQTFAGKSLTDLVAAYDALQEAKAAHEQELDAINAVIAAHDRAIVGMMEDLGESFVKLDIGGSIGFNDTPSFAFVDPVRFDAYVDAHMPELKKCSRSDRENLAKAALEAGTPLPPGVELSHVYTRLSRKGK